MKTLNWALLSHHHYMTAWKDHCESASLWCPGNHPQPAWSRAAFAQVFQRVVLHGSWEAQKARLVLFSTSTFLSAILISAWIQKAALAHEFNKACRRARLKSFWNRVWVTAPEQIKSMSSFHFGSKQKLVCSTCCIPASRCSPCRLGKSLSLLSHVLMVQKLKHPSAVGAHMH